MGIFGILLIFGFCFGGIEGMILFPFLLFFGGILIVTWLWIPVLILWIYHCYSEKQFVEVKSRKRSPKERAQYLKELDEWKKERGIR